MQKWRVSTEPLLKVLTERLAYTITMYARMVEPAIYGKYVIDIKNAHATQCKGRLFRLSVFWNFKRCKHTYLF